MARQTYPALGWLLQRAQWVGCVCPSLIVLYKRHAAFKQTFIEEACITLAYNGIICLTDQTWLQTVSSDEAEIFRAELAQRKSIHYLLLKAHQAGKSRVQIAYQLKLNIEAVELYVQRLGIVTKERTHYRDDDPLPFPLPPIPTDEQVSNFVDLHGSDNPVTARWLETQFLQLLKMCAIHHGPDGLAMDDLIQEGWLGLRSAARNYQARGKFHTYAWVCMRCRMRYAILYWRYGAGGFAKMQKYGLKRIFAYRDGFAKRLGRLPTYAEIAHGLGIPIEDARVLLSHPKRFSDLDLDSHENLVMNKLALSPLKELEQREMREAVAEALAEFSEADQYLLLEHFVEGRTITELARERDDGGGWLTHARLEFITDKFKKKLRALGIDQQHVFD